MTVNSTPPIQIRQLISTTRTKLADLFIVCYRSAGTSVADLQTIYRSSTDFLQNVCRMSAEYLQNICRMSAERLQR